MADTPAEQSHLHPFGNRPRSPVEVENSSVESATEKDALAAVSLDMPSWVEESHGSKVAAGYIILSALLTSILIVIGLIIAVIRAIT